MNRRRNFFLSALILLAGLGSVLCILGFKDPGKAGCVGMDTGEVNNIGTFSSINKSTQDLVQNSLANIVQESQSTRGLVVVQQVATGRIVTIAAQEGKADTKCFGGWTEAFKSYEPGSVMKPLAASAALNEHRMTLSDQFYNPGKLRFGDVTLLNAINIPARDYSYQDMVSQSINIGAVEALKRLSDKQAIDIQARRTWYDYLTKKFLFGKPTGAYSKEQSGYIPTPEGYSGNQARYAHTSFGIGLTLSPVQLTSAYAAMINRGMYVVPKLQVSVMQPPGHQAVSAETSATVIQMLMIAAETSNQPALRPGYVIGGKSGTAPSSDLTGTYQYYNSIGTYIGFIGKTKPEYVVLMKLNEPKESDTLAGKAAAMAWAKTTGQIIDSGFLLE